MNEKRYLYTKELIYQGVVDLKFNTSRCIDHITTFFDVQRREQIIKFLDTKIKTIEEDPDARWITTWNHYLSHIKYFFRWLYNVYHKKNPESFSNTEVNNTHYYFPSSSYYDWQTPSFIQIRKKKTKRTSPYLETELWERDDLLCILKSLIKQAYEKQAYEKS